MSQEGAQPQGLQGRGHEQVTAGDLSRAEHTSDRGKGLVEEFVSEPSSLAELLRGVRVVLRSQDVK